MSVISEELALIQTIETILKHIEIFISDAQTQVFEEVKMDVLMEWLTALELNLTALQSRVPLQEHEVLPEVWENLQLKKSEVKILFKTTLQSLESWREMAWKEGQTINLKVKAGCSYNQMKPL